MVAIGNAEDDEVLCGVTVIMVIMDHAGFYVIDSEYEALSSWVYINNRIKINIIYHIIYDNTDL